MPGIVGYIGKRGRQFAESTLQKMQSAVHRESFYSSGSWIDETLGVYVGWTALSGSFSDGMPVLNERKDTCLIFSGEDYGDPSVRETLRKSGHSVGSAPSSYLVHLYEEDADFVRGLNGMFHGLVADRVRNTVTLFNDRFGMHRLYYHVAADGFYFASEAKAILAARPELRSSDARSLGECLSVSCVLENRTIFKDVYVLPAASQWTFSNAKLDRKKTYFTPSEWENQTELGADAYFEELRSVLSTTLPRYFDSPLQMGIAMTGGLDTRVILTSHLPSPGSLPSYTFGSTYRDTYDVRIGRKLAKICQQPHKILEVGREFLSGFSSYAEQSVSITEGTVDLYRASDLYLSKKVREIAPVKIVGTYGSEIVRHAVMFKPAMPMPGLFTPDFLSHVQAAENTYAVLRKEHPVTFAAFMQSPWYHSGILALEQSQLTVRSPFMGNDFVRTVYRAPKENHAKEDVRLRLINNGNPALARIRSDRGVGGSSGLSAAVSRALREFTFKAEYAYDYGMPQSVARVDHSLSWLHLEKLFLGRHKLLHFRLWYRDQLADYVRQILLDPIALSRPYVERKTLEAVVQGHLSGKRNYTTAIHKLLTLELLHRRFLDAQ